jgi:hypothetical protein
MTSFKVNSFRTCFRLKNDLVGGEPGNSAASLPRRESISITDKRQSSNDWRKDYPKC